MKYVGKESSKTVKPYK